MARPRPHAGALAATLAGLLAFAAAAAAWQIPRAPKGGFSGGSASGSGGYKGYISTSPAPPPAQTDGRRDYLKLDAFRGEICGRPQVPAVQPSARRAGRDHYHGQFNESYHYDHLIENLRQYNSINCWNNPTTKKTNNNSSGAVKKRHSKGRSRRRASLEVRALKGEFPWFVRLELHFANATVAYCGATLIHPNYLLTSASCYNRARLGLALTGTASAGIYSLLEPAERWQQRAIQATCSMPNFQPPGAGYPENGQGGGEGFVNASGRARPEPAGSGSKREDVLLMALDRPLVYSTRVQPACVLDPLSSWQQEETPETLFAMAGLGAIGEGPDAAVPAAHVNRLMLRKCATTDKPPPAADLICLGPLAEPQLAGVPCEGDQGNGAFLRMGSDRVRLAAILSQPASSCNSAAKRGALFSSLALLQHELDYMLASCLKLLEAAAGAGERRRPRAVRSPIELPRIEHLTIERRGQERD